MYHRSRFVCALPLVLGACNFSVDPSLVRDGGTPSVDGGGDVDPPDTVDIDAGRSGDGSVVIGQAADSETPAPDAQVDSGPLPCSGDADCPADEFCSTPDGARCVQRCTDERGCAELAVETEALTSDENYVYWGTRSAPYTLMAWDGRRDPFAVSTEGEFSSVLFAIDDTLYFKTEGELRRVPIRAGSTSERIAGRTIAAWYTPTFVYWTANRAGRHELWRLARSGGEAELRRTLEDVIMYIGGDDAHTYAWVPRPGETGSMLIEEDVSTFAARNLFASQYSPSYTLPYASMRAVRSGPWLFVSDPETPNLPVRIDLTTLETAWSYGLYTDSHTTWSLEGTGWVYGSGTSYPDSYRFSLARVRQDAPSQSEKLVTIDYDPSVTRSEGGSFTVFGSLLVYSLEGHLFTKPVTQ